jgi:hypothetical protein
VTFTERYVLVFVHMALGKLEQFTIVVQKEKERKVDLGRDSLNS